MDTSPNNTMEQISRQTGVIGVMNRDIQNQETFLLTMWEWAQVIADLSLTPKLVNRLDKACTMSTTMGRLVWKVTKPNKGLEFVALSTWDKLQVEDSLHSLQCSGTTNQPTLWINSRVL